MKNLYFFTTLLLLFVNTGFAPIIQNDETTVSISAEEKKLYQLVMSYRKSKKLPEIPLSKSLTMVAQIHGKDLAEHHPDHKKNCNAHSWSNKGKWTSCCYTPDHKKANCMWDKPRELTHYTDDGFEIVCTLVDPDDPNKQMTGEMALDIWKKSKHHNDLIINKDIWKKINWNAIGICIYKNYATIWFGKMEDSEGAPIEK